MKKLLYSLPFMAAVLALAGLTLASCTQEEPLEPQQDPEPAFEIVGNPVDACLDIAVGGLSVVSTRGGEVSDGDPEDDTEAERKVNSLWVFQYDASSTQLIMIPQYQTISDQEDLADLKVKLSDNNGNPSIIYVVTNTSSEWARFNSSTETYDGFMTLAELKAKSIPTPEPQRMIWDGEKYVSYDGSSISIPMSGLKQVDEVIEDEVITVDVQRMYAKIYIKVDLSNFNPDYEGALVYDVNVIHIMSYSTVASTWSVENESEAADYSACTSWITRTFSPSTEAETADYPYVIYVPESIQGENGTSDDKAENIPPAVVSSYDTDALAIEVRINAVTMDGATMGPYSFTAYPGGNDTDNFNVRRNCVYKVSMRIDNLNEDDLVLPSANCIVCLSGITTTFYPYCRPETGGDYYFEDYVNSEYSDDDDDDSKRIESVEIIWQSESVTGRDGGFLGDNKDDTYVYIDGAPDDALDTETKSKKEYQRKINVYVPTGEYGNALIAARNKDGDIIWSWHIWSRLQGDDPSTLGHGMTYYTYQWDENGIYYDEARVPGYTVMNCNLGALADAPDVYTTNTDGYLASVPTYGMTYQWGRKDPIPPIKSAGNSTTAFDSVDYLTDIVGNYYDNYNNQVYMDFTVTTEAAAETSDVLFWSYTDPATSEEVEKNEGDAGGIKFSIQHPTVFMRGLSGNNYSWSYDDHDASIWGGKDPSDPSVTTLYLFSYDGKDIDLNNAYDGTEKSIFDPCPYGWRVSPPDIWLGFTRTGQNPELLSDINYDSSKTNSYGMTMYMDAWKDDNPNYESYFPAQGLIIGTNSKVYRVGTCGNYLNAISDYADRVNIIHLHYSIANFKLFETSTNYVIKSTGSSVRCVNINSKSSSN